jgi:hypothetical protein
MTNLELIAKLKTAKVAYYAKARELDRCVWSSESIDTRTVLMAPLFGCSAAMNPLCDTVPTYGILFFSFRPLYQIHDARDGTKELRLNTVPAGG